MIPGIGTGMLFSAQGFAAQASVSNSDIPFAGAMYSFFRAFGSTFGVAISGVVFQNTFKFKILATPYAAHAAEWSQDASAFVQVVKAWGKEGEEGIMREAVVTAYVESLRMVWIVMTIFAGVIFVASLIWIDELSLTRDVETEQGFIYEVQNGDAEEQRNSENVMELGIEAEKETAIETEAKKGSTDEEEESGISSKELDG